MFNFILIPTGLVQQLEAKSSQIFILRVIQLKPVSSTENMKHAMNRLVSKCKQSFLFLKAQVPKDFCPKTPPAQTIAPPTPPWLLLPGYSTSLPPSCWLAGWLRVGGTSIRLTKIVVDPSPPVGKEDVKLLDHLLHDDVWMGDQSAARHHLHISQGPSCPDGKRENLHLFSPSFLMVSSPSPVLLSLYPHSSQLSSPIHQDISRKI